MCMAFLSPACLSAASFQNKCEIVVSEGDWTTVYYVKEVNNGANSRNPGSYELQYNNQTNRFRIWYQGDWRDVVRSDKPNKGNWMFPAPGMGGRTVYKYFYYAG